MMGKNVKKNEISHEQIAIIMGEFGQEKKKKKIKILGGTKAIVMASIWIGKKRKKLNF